MAWRDPGAGSPQEDVTTVTWSWTARRAAPRAPSTVLGAATLPPTERKRRERRVDDVRPGHPGAGRRRRHTWSPTWRPSGAACTGQLAAVTFPAPTRRRCGPRDASMDRADGNRREVTAAGRAVPGARWAHEKGLPWERAAGAAPRLNHPRPTARRAASLAGRRRRATPTATARQAGVAQARQRRRRRTTPWPGHDEPELPEPLPRTEVCRGRRKALVRRSRSATPARHLLCADGGAATNR